MVDISKISDGTNTYDIKDSEARSELSNKQDTLVSGTNIKTINGNSLLGSGNITIESGTDVSSNKVNGAPLSNTSSHFFGISTSAASDAEKDVSIPSITELTAGVTIIVLPTITSTAANATLKLNNFTAYPIRYQNSAITTTTDAYTWTANTPSVFVFDGEYWRFVCQGYRQVYSTMSVSEGTTGTATTGRVVRADYLKSTILGTKLTGLSTSTTGTVAATDTMLVGIGKLQATKADKSAIPTVNNATLTIQKNGSNVATFTANASSNVTANISVPTTTSNVTSGSTAALTSGGAYTNLVRRLSTSSATGSASQGVYVDTNGRVQTCTAVTSTYTATGTAPVNGAAVSNAISTKQDTLVSGTNIKTINGNSLLGSGDLTVGATPDNSTISYDTNNALQTIAVKNVCDGSTLPIWHGTETQWNRGVAITWYYWQTSVTAMWTASTLPSSASWQSVIYGDGKFVTVASGNSNKAAYSTDGINWTASTLPSSAYWESVTYGDGKFVTVASGRNSNKAAYSTDGINWTASTLPSSEYWESVTYGDGKFIAVIEGSRSSNKIAYSTDGINWTETTMPNSTGWRVSYGDDKFVAIATDEYNSSNKAAYSTDGINWTASTLPSSAYWSSATYGDGKFVVVAWNSDKAAYSTDGINWTETTMPSSAYWIFTYGDGKFIAIGDTNKAAYSTDGINWTETTMPSSANWRVTYGDGKFVAVASSSDKAAIFTIQYDKCYTDTANPTTTSVVYSTPETTSSYTISSVTSGAITLSNNNTYYYNQSGNAFTYRTIGDAHPEYLAFIDGVGVKMGNTLIASATPITTSITSTSTDAEAPSAKAVYNEIGEVESALNTINSGS